MRLDAQFVQSPRWAISPIRIVIAQSYAGFAQHREKPKSGRIPLWSLLVRDNQFAIPPRHAQTGVNR